MLFTVKDPDCGMKVKERNAIVRLKYRDRTYYFYSSHSTKTFVEAN